MSHPTLKLIPGSEEVIPLIIETFLTSHGKAQGVFLLEKNALFSFSYAQMYEGPNDRVAYNIFQDTRYLSTLSEILVFISRDDQVDISEHMNFLKSLYYANGYELETLSQIPIKPYDSIKTLDTDEQMKSWLEKNVPAEVFFKMREAMSEIGNGNAEDALHDCRQAFEKLTVSSNVSNALNELVTNGLIEKGSSSRKKDFEAIQTVYHFTSTLGAHTSSGRPAPTYEQAEFGYLMTEVTIRYLVHILRKAKSLGIGLSDWIEIN